MAGSQLWHGASGMVDKIKILISLLARGQFIFFVEELRRRLYSNESFYGLRRELPIPFEPLPANLRLTIRPIREADVPKLLSLDAPNLSREEMRVRIQRLLMLKANIQTCYVAVTPDDNPCYMHWLIGPSENRKLQVLFHGGFPPLTKDEVMLEGAFTPEGYRGKGIMRWASPQITKKAADLGTRWVITFIPVANIASLKGAKRHGFKPCMIRRDKWRLFVRDITFSSLPAGTPYPPGVE